MPTITKTLASVEASKRPSTPVSVKNRPMTNEPRMLIVSVPHGNAVPSHFAATRVHQCRATPPSALPIAAQRRLPPPERAADRHQRVSHDPLRRFDARRIIGRERGRLLGARAPSPPL